MKIFKFNNLRTSFYFNATLVSVLPWALKVLGIIFLYGTIVKYLSKKQLLNKVLTSKTYILILLYCIVLIFSSIINSTEISNVFNATLIIFIYPLFVSVAALNEVQKKDILTGLFYAAILYTSYLALFLDWGQFFNPSYRGDADYDVFTALNGAFIFAYAIDKALFIVQKKYIQAIYYIVAIYGFSFIFIMKSRGIMSIIILMFLFFFYKKLYLKNKIGSKVVTLFSIFSLAFVMLLFVDIEGVITKIITVFHLSDEGSRSLSDGSGRFMVWEYALKELWPEAFWLGHGPRSNFELILNIFPIDGAHNFLIATAVDAGLIGLIFVSLFLLLPLMDFNSKLNEVFGYPYYILGIEGIMNENLLFSYGFPAAWVVLISIASLSVKKYGVEKC